METSTKIEFVQDITADQGVGIVMIGESVEDTGLGFSLYYGSSSCEMSDLGDCSADGLVWRANDFGSPDFCTHHYFPQEQLGYEFVEMKNVS